MVRALLAGRKTQTRRVVMKGIDPAEIEPPYFVPEWNLWCWSDGEKAFKATQFQAGDRLYVRETWKPHSTFAGMKPRDIPKSTTFYAADDRYAPSNTPWVPCIHMPRWASRLTLMVEAVKVERLNEISEADAIREGVTLIEEELEDPVEAYRLLWESLHGIGSWAENPFVVGVTFTVVRGNIDQLRAEAA